MSRRIQAGRETSPPLPRSKFPDQRATDTGRYKVHNRMESMAATQASPVFVWGEHVSYPEAEGQHTRMQDVLRRI